MIAMDFLWLVFGLLGCLSPFCVDYFAHEVWSLFQGLL